MTGKTPYCTLLTRHIHSVAMWSNTSIIRQKIPHDFEEKLQVLLILSYITKKWQWNCPNIPL